MTEKSMPTSMAKMCREALTGLLALFDDEGCFAEQHQDQASVAVEQGETALTILDRLLAAGDPRPLHRKAEELHAVLNAEGDPREAVIEAAKRISAEADKYYSAKTGLGGLFNAIQELADALSTLAGREG